MIKGIHGLIYTDDAAATRAFLRDVLGWDHIETTPGWLIFNSGPSELGVHPTTGIWEGQEFKSPRKHSISLICDDLESTMSDLKSKGATFTSDPVDHGFGPLVMMSLPGADDIMLYQPNYATAYEKA